MVSTLSATGVLSAAAARKSYSKIPEVMDVPNLIDLQLASFRWFIEDGLKALIEEISPVKDFNGNRMELEFIGYEFREPRLSEDECQHRDKDYSIPLYVKARLIIKATGEIKEPFEIFFGDMPLMTANGTFITSGTERVVVSQLLRSPGVYFTVQEDVATGRPLCHTSLIPSRGAWLEFETSNRDVISVKIDGRRKIPVTSFLRAIGYGTDQELVNMFSDVDNSMEHLYIQSSIDKDPLIRDTAGALIDIYGRLRPGDPANVENATKLVNEMFFSPDHYDLGAVGRYKVNRRLSLEGRVSEENRALTREDIVAIIKQIIKINNSIDHADDIDHLGNRRIRTVGELIQNQFRIGLLRLERVARERMSIVALDQVTPGGLINIRPVVAAVREFFGGSQLSQFMDQTNPLAELTMKRRLSAMGPGGLSRERAGFDVRDVHYSHYGRICPIETPEGPNIGLIGSLAAYGRVNRYGFIETPYRRVLRELPNHDPRLVGMALSEVLTDNSKTILAAGAVVDDKSFKTISKLSDRLVQVEPFVSDEIYYLSADEEDKYVIAQAHARLDARGRFIDDRIESRFGENYLYEPPLKLDFMDVSPKQIFSVAASLIPFLEHDDANRALMGANMQRQAVPLLRPEAPLVATGMEMEAVRYSGHVIFARNDGSVISVTSDKIVVKINDGLEDTYKLTKYKRTNQGTCINQRPMVSVGDTVKAGQVLADSSATENGELALGQNLVCAFMSWHGYNYEDAIILNERLIKDDRLTSLHISKHEIEARDTKLGVEEITRDIPNVGEESLRELDEEGIIRVGAEVGPDDILVGKITPKGETELSAEEKLLRAIFGEKAREVKDTSLRMPHGEWGKVIAVKVFSRDTGDDLPARVNKWVQVWVAQKRKISVGDKLAGRHGNKGIVSIIAPSEDMPFLPDGTPVDVILNPIGVPSRMNLGQILELHLGWAGHLLGFRVRTPVFDGATDVAIEDDLARATMAQMAGVIKLDYAEKNRKFVADATVAWLNARGFDGDKAFDDNYPGAARETCLRLWLEEQGVEDVRNIPESGLFDRTFKLARERNIPLPIDGKMELRDGKTGELFDQPITVGNMYILKLIHLVEDKVHARATGPYSLISQQPLGGKAQFGGQRFGEMEVWTLEAYGAAYNLQEMLTIKSDDVTGRAKAYESIVKGEDVSQPGVPESFKVLVKELQSLGLSVEVINEDERLLPAEHLKEIQPDEEQSELALAGELSARLLEVNDNDEEDTENEDE